MALSLVTPPAIEPVTLAEAKAHLYLQPEQADQDGYIATLIRVTRQRGERATRRAWITQTWDCFLDTWETEDTDVVYGGRIALPKPPLQTVPFIKYVDTQSVTQTWASSNYLVDAPVGPGAARGTVALTFANIWPVYQPISGAIQIRMVCGYGSTADAVPDILREAMLLDIGTLFETRQSVLTGQRAASIEISSTTREIYKSFRSL